MNAYLIPFVRAGHQYITRCQACKTTEGKAAKTCGTCLSDNVDVQYIGNLALPSQTINQ